MVFAIEWGFHRNLRSSMVRRRRGTSHTYKGLLAEPLPEPHALFTEADWDERERTIARKLALLIIDCGVNPTDPLAGHKALLALAIRHVPGFQVPPRRAGRPRERNDLELLMRFQVLM